MLRGLSGPETGDFLSPRPSLRFIGPEAQDGCLAKSQKSLVPGTGAVASAARVWPDG